MKKSREEIEQAILNALEQKPLSIQQIRKEIESNWSTVSEVLEELKRKLKVRELISTDQIKIFVKRDYPVFYGIPLDKEIIYEARALMKMILDEWKREKKTAPPLTTIQKIAVDVVDDCKLNLPVIEFHYGKVIPVIFDVENPLIEIDVRKISEYAKILECVKREIVKHTEIAWKERRNQYKRYKMNLFEIKEEIQLYFNEEDIEKINSEKLANKIIEFSLKYPLYDEEVYNLFRRFENSSILLLEIKAKKEKSKDYLQAIKNSFEKVLDLTTSHLFFNGFRKHISPENIQVFDIIKSIQMTAKIASVETSILELESFSSSIKMEEIPELASEDYKEVGKILLEGIEKE